MCNFIAQLIELCTSIVEVTGLHPVEALNFFQASFPPILSLNIIGALIVKCHVIASNLSNFFYIKLLRLFGTSQK